MLNLSATIKFLERLPIRDRDTGYLYPFRLRYNQRRILQRIYDEQVSKGLPIRVIIDKARRVGASSLIAGLGICHCVAELNARAVIAAHQKDTVKGLFDVPLTIVNYLRDGLMPDIAEPTQTRISIPHMGMQSSTLTVTTAGNLEGGRGLGFSFLHLSEAAFYLGKQPFTSLLPTVPDDPSTAIFIESTANGISGPGAEFRNFWYRAKDGINGYIAIFLSWLDDPTCRRDADEAADGAQNDDERSIVSLVACDAKCGRCPKCIKSLRCLAWRRWAIETKMMGDVDKFHQEYPTTDDESFVSSDQPAFTASEIALARIHVKHAPPLQRGRLEFDLSPAAKQPGVDIVFIPADDSPLHVWVKPERNRHYYIGGDAARGLHNRDYAALYVWCGENGVTCARYKGHIDPESTAELANLVGRWYNNAMVAIELTGNLGLWCQKVLRDKYRYPNLYRWKGRDDRILQGFVNRTSAGWETTSRTRPLMLAAFRAALRFNRCTIYDSLLLEQMEAAKVVDGRWEIDEQTHDDVFMAAQIGWIIGEQWHQVGMGGSKLLDIDEQTADTKSAESDNRAISAADPDVQMMSRRHWLKITSYIKRGGPPKVPLEGI